MKRIIILDLAGGLGNHIFLFEIANFIGSIGDSVILINKTEIDRKHASGKSTIEDFVLPDKVTYFELSRMMNRLYFGLKIFLRKFNSYKQSLTLVLDENYNTNDRNEIYDLVSKRKPKLIIISGYWQSFAYWNDNFNYKLKSEGHKLRELLSEIESINPVIFHYRLGKFNGSWEHSWGALSPKFLIDALATLKPDSTNSKAVWVFSNDLIEAKKLIEATEISPYKIFYIDDLALLPSELLLLFSKAKNLVCSNSTFSIVAAKIGRVKNVMVPSVLAKNGNSSLELPIEWNKVPSVWLE
jgi:hypothetical protein